MPWVHNEDSDWRIIRTVCIGVSFILSIAGLSAITYREFVIGGFGYNPPPPYRDLGLVLLLLGIILFILASVSGQKFTEEEKFKTHLR